MKIRVSKTAKSPTRVLFVCEDSKNPPPDFKGSCGETAVRHEQETVNIYCGLGKEEQCTERTLKTAAAKGIQKAAELQSPSLIKSIFENTPAGAASYCLPLRW